MDDTYNCMLIFVSGVGNVFSLWDRCQLTVILWQTRIMKNANFVGSKNETICGLKRL